MEFLGVCHFNSSSKYNCIEHFLIKFILELYVILNVPIMQYQFVIQHEYDIE